MTAELSLPDRASDRFHPGPARRAAWSGHGAHHVRTLVRRALDV